MSSTATTPTTPVLNWISDLPDTHMAPIGGSYVFDCRLTNPTTPVELRKAGSRVPVDGTKVKLDGQKFTISNLHIGNNGKYSCHANHVGNPKNFVLSVNIGRGKSIIKLS